MTDQDGNISDLKVMMKKFVNERNWNKYHHPKELAIALSIEANELLELFLFKTPDINRMLAENSPIRAAIKDEIADIFAYLLSITNSLNIDLSDAFISKMGKNEIKYPKSEFNGNYKKI
ncbi:MAG: nucleotide pyrophosphohydrolase [Promethearchaeota archaeon]